MHSWKRKISQTCGHGYMHVQRDEELWFQKRGDALKAFDTIIEMQSTQIIRMIGLMHVSASLITAVYHNRANACVCLHSWHVCVYVPVHAHELCLSCA
jgi:hypothetical protein